MPSGFKYRVLVADDDQDSLASIAAVLANEGYLVLTAQDGFEALAELQGAAPEILVSELKLPNMSGFELLAVVRQRFPGIGVIARSAEFCPAGELPEGVLADAFVRKGENSDFELVETIRELLSRSPLRAAHAKLEVAPAWLPRTPRGYVVITCPSCLRSSSLRTRDVQTGVVVNSCCLHCGESISYRLDSTTVNEPGESTVLEGAQRAVADSRKAITESRARMAKTHE